MAVDGRGSLLEPVALALKNENKSDVSEELFFSLSSYLEAKKKKLVALRLRNEDYYSSHKKRVSLWLWFYVSVLLA